MKKLPWHKRDHAAAIEGYMGLTLEERGAYTTLLDLMYDQAAPLIDNDRLLAGYLEVSARKYRAVRDALIEKGKIRVKDDGRLTNTRFEFELENLVNTRRTLSEAGSNGGRKRIENEKKRNEISEREQARLEDGLEAGLTIASARGDRDTVPNGTGGEPPDLTKELFGEGVAILVDAGAKLSSARSLIGKWRKEHHDPAILAAVREARAQGIAQPAAWIPKHLAQAALSAGKVIEFGGIRERIAKADRERDERRARIAAEEAAIAAERAGKQA